MGISDRDYTRDPNATSRNSADRSAGLRGRVFGARPLDRRESRLPWPVHVIVIMVCCAVFAIDSMLAPQPVQFGEWRAVPGREQAFADLSASRATYSVYPLYRDPKGKPVVDPSGRGLMGIWVGQLPEMTAKQYEPVATAPFAYVTPIKKWLQFTTAQAVWSFTPTGRVEGFEFWRFLGYGFLHVSLMHLLLNMVGLWVFGPIVEERFGGARFLALFLTATIAGALLFLVLNAAGIAWMKSQGSTVAVPGLLFNDPWIPLIGASGGVCGIVLAAAWLRPNEPMAILGIIPIKLKFLALGLVGISVYTLLAQGNNSGGEAAHLGGAIAGWWVAQRPHLLDGFFDLFGRAGTKVGGKTRAAPRTAPSEAEIDRILDKVREKGLGSLSERERTTLRNATDERKRDGRGS
jgi:membrane associated rhomboid family serine protease